MEQILQFGQTSFLLQSAKKKWSSLLFFLFLFSFQSVVAQDIVANRTVSNTHHCSNGTQYSAWLNFSGLNNYYQIIDGSFIEYDDGTADFTGIIKNNVDSDIKFSVDVTFSGRTFTPPTGSPKENNCYDEDTSDWYYYPTTEGTLTGLDDAEGALIELERAGPSFQVGTGANVTDSENFNASGWLTLTIISQPTTGLWLEGDNGDFNFRLSGESLPQCDNLTDGGQIGFGPNCADTEMLDNCPGTPSTILDCETPSGGSGVIEYLWLKSTTATNPPTGINDPNWTIIQGADEASYSPGLISETTYFFRCSRRAGCDAYAGEANIVTIECDDTPTNNTVCSSIADGDDDAEEDENGNVNLNSSDLELVIDFANNQNQTIGLRFVGLNIPRGAIIESANIQFTADATIEVDPCILNIYGEASDDAPAFSNSDFNITDRDTTSASVTWSPDNWENVGDAGAAQQTVNLASILQEIIERPGYEQSSAIAFIIKGIGKRTAVSFNGNPDQAPELCVMYNTECEDIDDDGICDDVDPCIGEETEISGNIISYENNHGVYTPECLIGMPDQNYANFYDHQDKINVKFGDLLPAGTEYTVVWKRRDYNSSYPGPARLDIYESEDGDNFTFNTTIETSSTSDVFETITTTTPTMFLKLVNASSNGDSSPDFKVDAVTYEYIVCDDTPPTSEDCCDEGDRPKKLVLQYTGEDCSASDHSQTDANSVSCDGDPDFDSEVYIIANDKIDPTDGDIWFTGNVRLNGTLVLDAANANENDLGPKTWIHIYAEEGGALLQTVMFHTSCSEPLFLGDQYGSVKLVGMVSKNGYVCDDNMAKIGDFVWEDMDRDGLQDDNEPGIAGVFVFLEDEFGNELDFQLTDSLGQYLFTNLEAGNYKIRFATPEDYSPTLFNIGDDIEIDSDANNFDGRSTVITLEPGEMNFSIDAGYFQGNLPVELLNFTAKLIEGNKVQLDWITESEQNNNYFVIQRSTDGERFQAIGTVEGNGTTSLVNSYVFIDKSPFFGRNYYRLKQVDFDGKFDFSQVESVVLDSEDLPDVIVYPNPTKDFTTLRVVSPFEQDATVEIVNTLGQVIETLSIAQGANDLEIDLRNYQPGMYFVNIKYDGFKKVMHPVLKVTD